ncbi:DUF7019 family protein [Sphaerisporangium aureirubrum]|uniref:DUF7019 family protein n=1 Tax=Sphaerisporangium aureirubrum TaxID=1544736 RepID=A0ABW1NP63_9ACTN
MPRWMRALRRDGEAGGRPGSGGRGDSGEGRIAYFCYVSRNKVDQLYEQIDPRALDEVVETRSRESTVTAEGGTEWGVPQVVNFFKGSAGYGRTGRIQREVKVKQSYMDKLRKVLLALAEERPILPAEALAPGGVSRYFHYSGMFKVAKPLTGHSAGQVVTITSKAGARRLMLDCSLRNFSEGPLPDGSFSVNSANARFFSKDMALPLTTVFLLLECGPDRVVGTPLFLRVSLPEADEMTAL